MSTVIVNATTARPSPTRAVGQRMRPHLRINSALQASWRDENNASRKSQAHSTWKDVVTIAARPALPRIGGKKKRESRSTCPKAPVLYERAMAYLVSIILLDGQARREPRRRQVPRM